MIFPQYNYKEYNNDNKHEWSLQPPTIENWCKMVNDAYKYCKNIKDIYEYKGKCIETDLPSFHPFFENEVKKQTEIIHKQTKGLIAQAQKYIDNNGYYTVNAKESILRHKEFLKYLESKL